MSKITRLTSRQDEYKSLRKAAICKLLGHKPDSYPGVWSDEHDGYISHCERCKREIVGKPRIKWDVR